MGFIVFNEGSSRLYKTGFDGKEQIIRFAKKRGYHGFQVNHYPRKGLYHGESA